MHKLLRLAWPALLGILVGCTLDGAPSSFGSLSESGVDGVIYGENSIMEISQKEGSSGTVSLFTQESFTAFTQGPGVYTVAEKYGALSSDLAWSAQPSASYCSGIMIKPGWVLTAGHCISAPYSCEETVVVANYHEQTATRDLISARCVEVRKVQVDLEGSGLDYALIRLDSENPTPPLRFAKKPLTLGAKIYTLGSPLGSYQKKSVGKIRALSKMHVYESNLDVFEGHSGSPVFSVVTGELIGILSGGEADFNDDGAVKRCGNHECTGEFIIPIQKILADLKK